MRVETREYAIGSLSVFIFNSQDIDMAGACLTDMWTINGLDRIFEIQHSGHLGLKMLAKVIAFNPYGFKIGEPICILLNPDTRSASIASEEYPNGISVPLRLSIDEGYESDVDDDMDTDIEYSVKNSEILKDETRDNVDPKKQNQRDRKRRYVESLEDELDKAADIVERLQKRLKK